MKGPSQRSIDKLRREGYRVANAEKYNAYTKKSQDLFGIIDLVAIGNGETIGVQATTANNQATRAKKMLESEALEELIECGWRIVVHGWRKNTKGTRWICNEIDMKEKLNEL